MPYLHRQSRMFTLQCLYPCQFIQADRALAALGSFGCPRIHLTPIHDFLFPPLVSHFRQPIPEAVRSEQLAAPFLEQIGGVPWGDLGNDASGLQFVGDCSPRPLTDRAPSLNRRSAHDGGDLTTLFSGDLSCGPWSRRILETLCSTERLQVDPLQSTPMAFGDLE